MGGGGEGREGQRQDRESWRARRERRRRSHRRRVRDCCGTVAQPMDAMLAGRQSATLTGPRSPQPPVSRWVAFVVLCGGRMFHLSDCRRRSAPHSETMACAAAAALAATLLLFSARADSAPAVPSWSYDGYARFPALWFGANADGVRCCCWAVSGTEGEMGQRMRRAARCSIRRAARAVLVERHLRTG